MRRYTGVITFYLSSCLKEQRKNHCAAAPLLFLPRKSRIIIVKIKARVSFLKIISPFAWRVACRESPVTFR